MNIPQAKQHLSHIIKAGLQPLLVGPPGIGKTAIVKQAAVELGYRLIISHPVVSDPTDFKGLAFLVNDGKEAAFLPIGQLVDLINTDEPTIWFIDDLGQALPTVQAALMQLVHRDGRSLGQHRLSEHVHIVAATNRADDGAMVRGMISPLRSRFQLIINVEADLDAWIPYAMEKGIDPRIIAFLKYSQHNGRDCFFVHNADMSDISQVCCPRSWAESVSDLLKIEHLVLTDTQDRLELLAAAISEPVAIEFNAFMNAAKRMVSITDILAAPLAAPLPQDLDITYMTVTGLAHRAITSDNGPREINAMCDYIMRLSGEFCELFRFTVAQSKKTELIETAGMVRLANRSAI